jgi:hypothetical protein
LGVFAGCRAGSWPTNSAIDICHHLLPAVLAAGGFLTGGAASLAATVRAVQRRRFIRSAEAGKVAGYVVETRGSAKVLLRVPTPDYRNADVEEVVYRDAVVGTDTAQRA